MAFKSGNFYLGNVDDVAVINSNTYNYGGAFPSGINSSKYLYNSNISSSWSFAVDQSSFAVLHNNVSIVYRISDLFSNTGGGTALKSESVEINLIADSVAIDSGYVFLGVKSSNSVYKYSKSGTLQQIITSNRANNTSGFGHKVLAKDGMLLVSAPNNFSNIGSVHAFDYDGIEKGILTPISNNTYTNYGSSLAIGDNRVLVGAPKDNEGRVYVYSYNSLEHKFTLSGPNTYSNFGNYLDVGFSRLLIGAPNATSKGGAYIYSTNGAQVAYLDPIAIGVIGPVIFGNTVCIESGKCIVTAMSTDNITDYNQVYSFDMNGGNISSALNTSYAGENCGVGLVSSNGVVYMGSGNQTFAFQRIFTATVPNYIHILGKEI